jgi:glycosyltransferase involved in cell wall biosynthesis
MKPLRLIFVYGKSSRLNPNRSPDARGAGIVTALHGLARELAGRGHDVSVFGRVREPAVVDGVAFCDRREISSVTYDAPPDALVVVPDLLPLWLPVPARSRIVWSGNAYLTGDVALTERWPWAPHLGRPGQRARLWPLHLYADLADRIIVKSYWQAEQVGQSSGLPLNKMSVIHNGVSPVFFERSSSVRQPARLIYTSQARRGLRTLLDLFPAIKAAVPDAELHVFGYDQAVDASPLDAWDIPAGASLQGAVDRPELAAALHEASIYVYPCSFTETFCTSVAEAQAAGLPVVATDLGALSERVDDGRNGYLIPGPAADASSQRVFVEAVTHLLADGSLRHQMGREAEAKARESYTWEAVAAQWERELLGQRRRPVTVPSFDDTINLLRPELLRLSDRGATADVPADAAEHWLRAAWSSYGFDPATAPGLARGKDFVIT